MTTESTVLEKTISQTGQYNILQSKRPNQNEKGVPNPDQFVKIILLTY